MSDDRMALELISSAIKDVKDDVRSLDARLDKRLTTIEAAIDIFKEKKAKWEGGHAVLTVVLITAYEVGKLLFERFSH